MGRRSFRQVGVVAFAVVAGWLASGGLAVSARRPARSTPRPSPSTGATDAVPVAPLPPPTLMARPSPAEAPTPLKVTSLEVRAMIHGFLARTTTTITFRNDLGRVLEGELVFPLPEGSALSGYALDIGGRMVDGVVVEQHQARVVFEKEERRGIDPGLVEWVRGSTFRTRVWPIPAHGTRTVRVEYVSSLVTEGVGDTMAALYHLPLRHPDPIDEFSLRVEVARTGEAPELRSSSLANFRFGAFEDRYVAETKMQHASLGEDLTVALPRVARAPVAVETDERGDAYFTVDDYPELPAAPPATRPHRVGLLWDASLSHRAAAHEREQAVLRAWLERLGDVDVVLTVFRNVPEKPKVIPVRGGDPRPVLEAVMAEPTDGATDLAALRTPGDVAYSVLVSDGLVTQGTALPSFEGPVFVLSDDSAADHGLLRHLAERTGGAYLNLAGIATVDAAAALGAPANVLAGVDCSVGAATEIFPSGARSVQGRVTVTGRLVSPEAVLTLRYRTARGTELKRRITVRRTDARLRGLVSRYWAQQKVSELAVEPERHRDELLRIARRFGIVTPGASLLVLERLDQYVEHGIEPPASLSEMRDAYRKMTSERKAGETASKKDKLEQVVAMWDARVEWWGRDFATGREDRERALRKTRQSRSASRDGAPGTRLGLAGGAAGAAESGPLPPPPPPLPPRAARPALPRDAAPALRGSLTETVEVQAEMQAVQASTASMESIAVSSPKKDGGEAARNQATIAVTPWDPKTPYLRALRAAAPADAYRVYLDERQSFEGVPGFFVDCADFFLDKGKRDLGLRILSNVVELRLDDPRLLRVAAHRLRQLGEFDLAIELFEKVQRLRPEEPQSPRDLALALTARADAARARHADAEAVGADYVRALGLLNDVVLGAWGDRFPEIEVVALIDANRLLAIMDREKLPGIERVALDKRLRHLLDVDVRIVLTWDTDDSDMDLWVTEPSGEKCDYSDNLTLQGGMISRDFTDGYGPEEYLVRRADAGQYLIQANYYGSRAPSLTGPTTAQATIITHFGRPDEERQELTLRLTETKEVVDIGSVSVGTKGR